MFLYKHALPLFCSEFMNLSFKFNVCEYSEGIVTNTYTLFLRMSLLYAKKSKVGKRFFFLRKLKD